MTMDGEERISARYQQVLAWRNAGVTYPEMGRRLGISPQRASRLGRQARRWHQRLLLQPLPTPALPLPLGMSVQALPISVQAKRALWQAGLHTVGLAAQMSDASLLRLPGIGPGTVTTLRAHLATHDQVDAA